MKPRLRLYTKASYYLDVLHSIIRPSAFPARLTDLAAERLSQYTGLEHVIPVSMGRMAIYEGLRALPVRKGCDEIILSPITVPEVISMVILAGYRPVFCDIEPHTWNLDPELAAGKITGRTAAIMTTHFYGYTNTTGPVRSLCDKHGLYMIEDSAQALGAFPGGVHAGKSADFTIFSFSYPKNITSFYGGAFATDKKELADRVRANIAGYPETFCNSWYHARVRDCLVKDCGTSGVLFPLAFLLIRLGYEFDVAGIKNLVEQHLSEKRLLSVPEEYRYRFTPLQAGMILKKIDEVSADVTTRIGYAAIYHDALQGEEGITVAPLHMDTSHTYLYYPVRVKNKYDLMQYLIKNGRDVAMQHAANCAGLEAYREFYADCPLARAAYQGTLMLPTYPSYGSGEAHKTAAAIQKYLRGHDA